MTPKINIADDSLEQIQEQTIGTCGVEVEDQQHAGMRFVLMTVEGYQQLKNLVYDDSDLTPQEMMAATTTWLKESDGVNDDLYQDLDSTSPPS